MAAAVIATGKRICGGTLVTLARTVRDSAAGIFYLYYKCNIDADSDVDTCARVSTEKEN